MEEYFDQSNTHIITFEEIIAKVLLKLYFVLLDSVLLSIFKSFVFYPWLSVIDIFLDFSSILKITRQSSVNNWKGIRSFCAMTVLSFTFRNINVGRMILSNSLKLSAVRSPQNEVFNVMFLGTLQCGCVMKTIWNIQVLSHRKHLYYLWAIILLKLCMHFLIHSLHCFTRHHLCHLST